MKQEDFEEYIAYIQNKKFVSSRKDSLVVNNFYTLITIAMVCIAIYLYTNYVAN
jgi:tellurite resistance protein TehA-like permease